MHSSLGHMISKNVSYVTAKGIYTIIGDKIDWLLI